MLTSVVHLSAAARELADEKSALLRIAKLVAGGADPAVVLEAVAREIGVLSQAESTRLMRLAPDGSRRPVAVWPPDAQAPPPAQTITVGCALAGRRWGEVELFEEHAGLPLGDVERLVADFFELVALAIANAEVRDALAASRRRLLDAADAARKRIEEALHAGPRRRLEELAAELESAGASLQADPDRTVGRIKAARGRLDGALEELQLLSRGIHPFLLTERGLDVALQDLAGSGDLSVTVDSTVEARLATTTELAGYYVVVEALENAVTHAHAGRCHVRAQLRARTLVIEVCDDGVGGAHIKPGGGLLRLRDRVAALGGELLLDTPQSGTTIRATIPGATDA